MCLFYSEYYLNPFNESVPPPAQSLLGPVRSLSLLLNNLDDVLVLHDVCKADPLRAVLGAGSLEDQQTVEFRVFLFEFEIK